MLSESWWINVPYSLPSNEMTQRHVLPSFKKFPLDKVPGPHRVTSLLMHTILAAFSLISHFSFSQQCLLVSSPTKTSHTQLFVSWSLSGGPNLNHQERRWKLSQSALTFPGSCVCVYSMCYLPSYRPHSSLETTTYTQFWWILVPKLKWPSLSCLHLRQSLSSLSLIDKSTLVSCDPVSSTLSSSPCYLHSHSI